MVMEMGRNCGMRMCFAEIARSDSREKIKFRLRGYLTQLRTAFVIPQISHVRIYVFRWYISRKFTMKTRPIYYGLFLVRKLHLVTPFYVFINLEKI